MKWSLRTGGVAGILLRSDLVNTVAEGVRQTRVESTTRHNCTAVEASKPLRAALEKMRQGECFTLPFSPGTVEPGRP